VCHTAPTTFPPFGVAIAPLAARISAKLGNLLCTHSAAHSSATLFIIQATGSLHTVPYKYIHYGHNSCLIPNFCTGHMWAGFAVGVCGKVPNGKSLNRSFAYGGGSGLYGLSHPRIDMVGDDDNSQPIPAKGIVVLTCSFGLLISYCLGSPVIASRPRRTTR